jgi:hypothetical protein
MSEDFMNDANVASLLQQQNQLNMQHHHQSNGISPSSPSSSTSSVLSSSSSSSSSAIAAAAAVQAFLQQQQNNNNTQSSAAAAAAAAGLLNSLNKNNASSNNNNANNANFLNYLGGLLGQAELGKLNMDVKNFKLQDSNNDLALNLLNKNKLNQSLNKQQLVNNGQQRQRSYNKLNKLDENGDDEDPVVAAAMLAAAQAYNQGNVLNGANKYKKNARNMLKANSMSPSPHGSCSDETEVSASGSPSTMINEDNKQNKRALKGKLNRI